MTGKTALVVGATGLVGRSLVDQLAAAPHIGQVVTLTRRAVAHASPNVVNHVVDFDQLDRFGHLFHGQYLFSTLGTTLKQAGSREAQRRVDVDYQFAAARLAARNGVAHYLLLSSSYADPGSSNFYTRIKGELEQKVSVLDFPRVSIFQPFVLVGERPDRRPAEKAAAVIFRVLGALPGLQQFQPVTGAGVAAKMVSASNAPGPPREWFRRAEMAAPKG